MAAALLLARQRISWRRLRAWHSRDCEKILSRAGTSRSAAPHLAGCDDAIAMCATCVRIARTPVSHMRTPRDALSPGYTHLILAAVVIATAGSSIALLYRASFRQQEDRLTETVTSRARLMEAVAQFDAVYSATDVPSGATAATLGQVRQAHERFQGFGATGEFTLARREGDEIVFVMRQRHSGLAERTSVPLDSALAEPMRRALRGESGTLVGADYRGARVLAAHEPVDTLGLGVVAKIDLAEIREPFLRA